MNELEVDMEELEARLYGQVYHVSNFNEDLTPSCEIKNDIPVQTFPRYFQERLPPTPFYTNIGLNPCSLFNPLNNVLVVPPQTHVFTQPREDSQRWLKKILRSMERVRMRKQRRKKKRLKRKEEKEKLKVKVEDPVKEECEVKDPVMVIDDDSDTNTNMSDVVIVETPTEIISIDCEDVDSDSHRVLEETFESAASNDFLDVSLGQKSGLSPIKSRDNGETVSCNSSTVDYTENFRGNKVLSEFNTNPGNNTFSELNLDSFTNYIECNGKTSGEIPTLSNSLIERINQRKVVDSSSESEYEDCLEDLDIVSDVSLSNYVIGEWMAPQKTESVINVEEKDDVICVDNKETPSETVETKLDDGGTVAEQELSVIEIDVSALENVTKDDDVVFIDDDNSVSSMELCLKESDREIINSTKILNVESGSAEYPQKVQKSKPMRFMDYWTEDMNKFYRESWGHEDFSVVDEQRKMTDDPRLWKIIPNDKMNLNCGPRQPRCRHCHEFGHIAVKCTKKLGPPKCILCGASGHLESRCPDKMCTSCGRRSNYFTTYCSGCAINRHVICSICGMKGHMFYNCSDLWRRYLFTTTDGAPVRQPIGADVKEPENQWCSGCGGNGHFEQTCDYYNRTHLPNSVYIYNYTDVYRNRQPSENTQNQPEQTQGPSTNIDLKDNSTCSWQLTPKEEHRLVSEGSKFLKTVEKTLKVKIAMNGRSCTITGFRNKMVRAKTAIVRFCVNADFQRYRLINKFSFKTNECNRENLKRNFEYLENLTVNWRNVAKGLFHALTVRTQANTEEIYRKLNTIILSKLGLGDAKNHMEVLERCLTEDGEVTEESFRYIFNNTNEITRNYWNLIERLPCEGHQLIYSKYLEVENLKRALVDVCDRSKSDLIEKFYSLVIIHNYSKTSVTNFKNAARKLLIKDQPSKCSRRKKLKKILGAF